MWVKENNYFRWDGPELTNDEILALPSPVTKEVKDNYNALVFDAVCNFVKVLILNEAFIVKLKQVTEIELTKENILEEIKTNRQLFDIFFQQMIINQVWYKKYHDRLYAPCLIPDLR